MTMVEVIEAVARADGAAGWCTMIAVDDVVDGAVPAAGDGEGDLRRPDRRHRWRVRPERRRHRRRRRVPGDRPLAVGERHPALPVDPRRRELRRRHVPPLLLRRRRRRRSTTRGTRPGCAARARSTSPSTTCSCRWTARSSPGSPGRRRRAARRVPELRPPRRRRRGGQPRHRAPGARRARRPGGGQAPAVLVAHARRERLHPDRGRPRRGRLASGAGRSCSTSSGAAWDVACRRRSGRPRPRVGIRLACVHAAVGRRRGRPTPRTPSPAAPACTSRNLLQRCLRDAHVVTQHIMVAPKLNETLGKLLLGLDADAL